MHSIREPVEAGGLSSYRPSLSEMTVATCFLAKILKGAKPAGCLSLSLIDSCVNKNSLRVDCVIESSNFSGDDRLVLPLLDHARLAVQVDELT
jgi:hypothetical protein